ncbi:Growth regulator [Staphylococcus microti]|uniref:Growth regulator n=1 Tax=Staphylococcus microti TaxID=569857 RepID=A0A380GSQ4_9STAP|nr:AbrB family transcriptional regulator [Staphylococcus microti]SUM56783.1 Growth regulator [Staphylococcus microti]
MTTQSKIFKNGNSQAISLNKTLMQQAGFHIGDELDVTIQEEALLFTKKNKTIKDEIQDFYKNGGKYTESEIDYGESRGSELW